MVFHLNAANITGMTVELWINRTKIFSSNNNRNAEHDERKTINAAIIITPLFSFM